MAVYLQRPGRCKATWEREFKLPWREDDPPNHHDDKVDSDQGVVNKELSLSGRVPATPFLLYRKGWCFTPLLYKKGPLQNVDVQKGPLLSSPYCLTRRQLLE